MTRLVVVGCVKGKQKHTVPLRDLYQGQLWTARRGYAEASGHDWLVLSLKAFASATFPQSA